MWTQGTGGVLWCLALGHLINSEPPAMSFEPFLSSFCDLVRRIVLHGETTAKGECHYNGKHKEHVIMFRWGIRVNQDCKDWAENCSKIICRLNAHKPKCQPAYTDGKVAMTVGLVRSYNFEFRNIVLLLFVKEVVMLLCGWTPTYSLNQTKHQIIGIKLELNA